MIFDNIKNAKTYFNLDEKIKKGLEFILNNDLNDSFLVSRILYIV